MSDFPITTLVEAGVRLIDCDHRTPKAQPAGLPYVGIPQMKAGHIDFSDARLISEEDFRDWTRKARPQRYDVILSRRTNPGVVAVDRTETPFALGQNLVLLRSDGSKVHPPFLRWLCQSPAWWEQIEKFINVGAVFSSLRCADVPKFEVPIPDRRTQDGIAATLDALDDKIELNRRMAATLEEMARALWRSWFVDFDPVRARAAGEAPAFMDETTAALFPARFGADGLPEGWSSQSVGDAVEVVGGSTPSTKNPDYWDGDLLWATPRDLSKLDKPVIFDTERKITALGVSQISSGQLPAGSLLLSSRAPVGYLAITQRPMSVNQGFIAMKPGGTVSPSYLLFWCKENMEVIVANANGSTFQEISKRNFRPLPVVVPIPAVLDAFEQQGGGMLAMIANCEAQSRTLADLRDALLPRLMSGELRVREAEALVAEVA